MALTLLTLGLYRFWGTVRMRRTLATRPAHSCVESVSQGLAALESLAQALSGLRAGRVTSIVITHRPSLMAHVDKILVLGAGRVQSFGPASDVMKDMQRQAQVIVGNKSA